MTLRARREPGPAGGSGSMTLGRADGGGRTEGGRHGVLESGMMLIVVIKK